MLGLHGSISFRRYRTIVLMDLSIGSDLFRGQGRMEYSSPLETINRRRKLNNTVVQIWSSAEDAGTDAENVLNTDILGSNKGLTFWRPQPSTGYAVFGDCVTAGSGQPAFQVCRNNHLSHSSSY